MKQKIQKFLKLREDKRYRPIFDVGIFALLLFFVHYTYIWWSSAGFPPVKSLVDQLFISASAILFDQSVWVVQHLFGMDITTQGQNILFVTSEGTTGYVGVEPGCTSLKQWVHWIVLMLLFPGPWKHKLWYIPMGVVVIHFVNLIRITGLVVTTTAWPQSFEFFHNYIFKTFFYFMIFLMWVVWVEYFASKERL
ncbi:MAG: archaeosortase/exosortase family protein [Lentimicrobium sp.]|jgi:exosortase/archaeosortase family protein|nr:archaeosortase/exosortase family protein [Lentimicrobium sp.]